MQANLTHRIRARFAHALRFFAIRMQPPAETAQPPMPPAEEGPVYRDPKVLSWLHRGMVDTHRFGDPMSVRLRSEWYEFGGEPVAEGGDWPFDIGADSGCQPLGVDLSSVLVAGSLGNALYRVKVAYNVDVLKGDLAPADIARALHDVLDVRLVYTDAFGMEVAVVNFDVFQDEESSKKSAYAGDYVFPAGVVLSPFIGYRVAMRGVGPGTESDQYRVSVGVRFYFGPMEALTEQAAA